MKSLQSPDGTHGETHPVKLITIGRKATDYFRKRGYAIHASFSQITVDASYAQVKAIVEAITGFFLAKTVDEVHIVYTEFITSLHQRPRAVKFLPIERVEYTSGNAHAGNVEYIFEPAAPQLLGKLLPRYVKTQIYHLLLESLTSELGARMTAMSNATENAGELIETLTLSYNKARQTAITKELLEVVSGAEALQAGG